MDTIPAASQHHHHHTEPPRKSSSFNRLAFSATVHCFTGCAIGEVLGMVLATAFGWSALASVAAAIMLAFVFGYGFTLVPSSRTG